MRTSLNGSIRRLASNQWWNDLTLPDAGGHISFRPLGWFGQAKFKESLEGGPPLREGNFYGHLQVPSKAVVEHIQKVLKCRPVYLNSRQRDNGSTTFASETSMVDLSIEERGTYASINLFSTDESAFMMAVQFFSKILVPENADTSKGHVYTLAQTMAGYTISHIGVAGNDLVRTNYSDRVIEDYDHVVNDLHSDTPTGRLAIFSGEPGTGKTFLIRSLLKDVPKAAFVIIPPHLIEGLSTPEILPSLVNTKREMDGRIVLVLEDADHCLVPRKEGNMGAISSLLNLGDGILGSVLDIRIIATTNATDIELDPATQREGRLSRHIHVDALHPGEAARALSGILGKPVKEPSQPVTLAQVYSKARKLGWTPPKAAPQKPNSAVGLAMDVPMGMS